MKKLYLLSALLLACLSSWAQGTITTSFSGTVICLNNPIQVSYSASTSIIFNQLNQMTVQLSNSSGSFAQPTNLGSFYASAWVGTMTVYANNVPPGNGYRLRVISSSPAIIGSDNGTNLTVSTIPQVNVTPAQSSICPGGSVNLTASGAATYSWMAWPDSSSLSATSGQVVTASPAATTYYTLLGYNAQGCFGYGDAVVSVNNQNTVYAYYNQGVCPGGTLQLTAVGGNGTYNWVGPMGALAATTNTISIPNFGPQHYGTYTVTLTGGGTTCSGTATVNVGPPAAPIVTPTLTVCPGADIQLIADTPGAQPSYSWTGPNGFSSTLQAPLIQNPTAANFGTYTVYGVYGSCITDPAFVEVIMSPTLTVAAGADVTVTQGGTILLSASGSGGNYQWTGPNGYTATGANPYIFNASPMHTGDYTVTLSSTGCPSVSDVMHVQVDALNLISGTVYNDLNNNGTQDAGENGLQQYMVQLLPTFQYAFTDSFGVYSFYVPAGSYTVLPVTVNTAQTVAPANYTVGFTGNGQFSANNNFGIYTAPFQNMGVSIFESWNAAPGFTTKHIISVRNWGTSPMSGTIKYLRDAQLPTLNSSTTAGYTLSGDTLIWTYSNLQPGASTSRSVYMTVPTTLPLGTALSSTAWVTPTAGDNYLPNNIFTLAQTVVGSWDPNDKAVQPAGPITLQQAAAGIDLTYTIRFQNTGTAPAVNVMVLDTLSSLLDVSTFQVISASHNYHLNMRNPRVLEFVFSNIMLPDSNSNEPASHGYIVYKVRPNTSQQIGNLIENTARIYFDFNEAVVTNTTQTELGVLGAEEVLADAAALHLFPNPNSGSFKISLTDATAGAVQIKLVNLLGQEVFSQTAQANGTTFEHQVNTKNLSNGMYLLHVQQAGKTYTKRVVLQQ